MEKIIVTGTGYTHTTEVLDAKPFVSFLKMVKEVYKGTILSGHVDFMGVVLTVTKK